MPWLLALLGCGCPDFDDVVAVPDASVADPDRAIADVAFAVAEFAAWTERAGVCVDRVEIREEVESRGASGPIPVEGLYEPWRNGVVAADGPWLELTVRHELCHALDGQETLSFGREDLFPPDSIGELDLYETDAERLVEAFARACEATPEALTVTNTASLSCGVDLVSERDRFLHDVVYPGFPEGMAIVPGEPLVPSERRALHTLADAGATVVVGGDAHGLTLLVKTARRTHRGLEQQLLRLLDLDVDTGVVTRRWAHPLGDYTVDMPTFARFMPSDTDDTFVLVGRGTELHRVDRAGGSSVWTVPEGVEFIGPAAVAGGLLYAVAWGVEGVGLTAWHLDSGVQLRIDTGGLGALEGAIPQALWPAENGVEASFTDAYARLHRGEWTTWPAPPILDRLDAHGQARDFLLHAPDGRPQPATLDLDAGTWTVRPVCDGTFSRSTQLVTAAGRDWAVSADRDGDGPLVVWVAEVGL